MKHVTIIMVAVLLLAVLAACFGPAQDENQPLSKTSGFRSPRQATP
jgi:hypothetical protein